MSPSRPSPEQGLLSPSTDLDSSKPVLEVRDFAVKVGEGRVCFSAVDFELFAGELLWVRGVSGSGKSRLLRGIANLDTFHTGSVSLRRQTADSLGIPCWRRRVTYVADTPPPLICSSVAALKRVSTTFASHTNTSSWASFAPSEVDCLPEAHFENVPEVTEPERSFRGVTAYLGLDEGLLEQPFNSLSAGQKQRVSLSWAISCMPEVLLLDEPTSHLDLASSKKFEKLVSQLPCCKIWVTHSDEQIQRIPGRVLTLPEGTISDKI